MLERGIDTACGVGLDEMFTVCHRDKRWMAKSMVCESTGLGFDLET
ncbi:MAG: hypothetical protein OXC39_06165 [Candidatus Dadabacteria bacterium]|nr:hypothetical protein [Candidatus Dadabacteria bacterium]